jgi:hypothetical protein
MLNLFPRRRAPRPIRGLGQYSPPSYFDSGWAGVFVVGANAIGVDPLDLAKLLISESGFDPSAQNSIGCVGLNQICPSSQGVFNSDYTADQYTQLTVSQQLPFVFDYFRNWLSQYGLSSISARDLYWLNFLPATYVPGSPDSYVIATQGDGYYDANTSFDKTGKGTITAGDLQTALDDAATNHADLFAYLQGEICAAGGCIPGTPWLFLGGIAAGVGLYMLVKR